MVLRQIFSKYSSVSNFCKRFVLRTMTTNPAANSIFMKIIKREIPAKIAFEDDKCIAIHDINPKAPVHILVIPKEPIIGIGETNDSHTPLLGHLMTTVRKVAAQENLPKGYRVVINEGPDSGQEVPHLHIHILGGRQLGWPPG